MGRTQINLRLGNTLIARLDRLAKAESRSRNNLIELLVIQGTEALEKMEREGGPLEAVRADEWEEKIRNQSTMFDEEVKAMEKPAKGKMTDIDKAFEDEPVIDRSGGAPKRHLHHLVEVEGSRSMSNGQQWANFECSCGKSERRKV